MFDEDVADLLAFAHVRVLASTAGALGCAIGEKPDARAEPWGRLRVPRSDRFANGD